MTIAPQIASAAGWIAPAATMIAAMMTAANLGTRVTGWGFAVFALGSVAWILVAITSGQDNLLLTNALLCLVNIVGIWRWLGRRAVHDDGARAAAEASRHAAAPSLFSMATTVDRPVLDAEGRQVGHVVDLMTECASGRVAYVVAAEGSAVTLTERLHAVPWARIRIDDETVAISMTKAEFEMLPRIASDQWPVRPA